MSEALRRARRLLAVQAALERLVAWTSMDLECRDKQLQDQRQNLVRFIEEEAGFAGVFPTLVMRHLGALADRHAALVVEKNIGAERLREERARLRLAEGIVEATAREDRKMQDSRLLAELIDAAVECRRFRQRQGRSANLPHR